MVKADIVLDRYTRCMRHPKYQALRPPRAACIDCWSAWDYSAAKRREEPQFSVTDNGMHEVYIPPRLVKRLARKHLGLYLLRHRGKNTPYIVLGDTIRTLGPKESTCRPEPNSLSDAQPGETRRPSFKKLGLPAQRKRSSR